MVLTIGTSDKPLKGFKNNFVSAGSFSMLPLVVPVAEELKQTHPQIYYTAFEAIDWNEVYIYKLEPKDFRIVYELTKREYEKFLLKYPTPEDLERLSAIFENWQEYLKLLEADPRHTSQ